MASRPDRSCRWWVLPLVTALMLAGCSGPEEDDAAAPAGAPGSDAAVTPTPVATPTAAPTPTPPPAPAFEAESVADLGRLCGADNHVYPAAAAYIGAAPHPIAIFSREVGSTGYEQRYVFKPGFQPEDPQDVALLACMTGVKTGKAVGPCRYRTDRGARTVRVDGQRFTFEIFALDTGRRVARVAVAADFCPPTLITTRGGGLPRRMTSTLNDEHLFKLLNRYVKRAVP